MIEYEDNCVGCPPNMGCLGGACPYKHVPVIYCDKCGNKADYTYEGSDYCEGCLDEILNDDFKYLLITEKLEALDGDWKYIGGI